MKGDTLNQVERIWKYEI